MSQALENRNDALILETLEVLDRPLTRPELVEKTGIARTTLLNGLERLIRHTNVSSYPEERETKGRPKVFFYIEE